MIFDTHAHYDDKAFDSDRDSLMRQLPGGGIGYVVNVSASLSSVKSTVALTEQYPFVYGAVGIHPNETEELKESDIKDLKESLQLPKIVAVGEIGLDYYWDTPGRDIQKYWFERQLDLARDLDKPVIIHSRDAAEDTLNIIKAKGGADYRMVIHCYSYSVEMAREYLNMGYYLGIGGVVTFQNAKKLKEVVKYAPLDRLLLETDCPYLAPVPNRGKRNSSLNLPLVARAIAELKEIDYDSVIEAAYGNARRFYGI